MHNTGCRFVFTSPCPGGRQFGHGVPLPSGGGGRLQEVVSLVAVDDHVLARESRVTRAHRQQRAVFNIGDRAREASCCFVLTVPAVDARHPRNRVSLCPQVAGPNFQPSAGRVVKSL